MACVEGKWERGKPKGKERGKATPLPFFFLSFPFIRWLSGNLRLMGTRLLRQERNLPCICGREEEPAILISTFLLRMRRTYVASFGLPLRMNGMHRTQFDHTHLDLSTTRNLITRVLTICHVKLMQSTALEQKRFDLLSLSPTLHNLWLLLVLKKLKAVLHSEHNSKTQLHSETYIGI